MPDSKVELELALMQVEATLKRFFLCCLRLKSPMCMHIHDSADKNQNQRKLINTADIQQRFSVTSCKETKDRLGLTKKSFLVLSRMLSLLL